MGWVMLPARSRVYRSGCATIQGWSHAVWLATQSNTTRTPLSWHTRTKRLKSSIVPWSGCTAMWSRTANGDPWLPWERVRPLG